MVAAVAAVVLDTGTTSAITTPARRCSRSPRDATIVPASHSISHALTAACAAPTVAGAFGSVVPSRVLDTRDGTGAAKAAVAAKGSVAVKVTGINGSPDTASASDGIT